MKAYLKLLIGFMCLLIGLSHGYSFQHATSGHFVVSQDKAVPGDTIFFVLYLFEKANQPANINSVLPAALIDSEGKKIVQFNLKVVNGKSSNQITLPTTLNQGFYNLSVAISGNRFVTKRLRVVTSKQIDLRQARKLTVGVQGNLIRNAPVRIAFSGSIPGKTVYLFADEQPIDSVSSDSYGTGTFIIISNENQYTIKSGDQVVNLQTEDGGIAVNMNQAAEHIQLRLIRKNEGIELVNAFLISAESEEQQLGELRFGSSDYADLKLKTSELPTGIYTIRVRNQVGELLTEIPFYIDKIVADRIQVKLNEGSIVPGDWVNWTIDATEYDQNKVWGLSALIKHEKYLSPTDTIGLDRLIGFSELPSYLLQGDWQKEHKQAINNYLISTSNRRHSYTKNTDQVFKNGSLITGTVIDLSSDLPVEQNSRLSIFFQEATRLIQINPSRGGQIEVNTTGIYGKQNIFVLAENPSGERIDVRIDWDQLQLSNWPSAAHHVEGTEQDDYVAYRQINQVIRKSYQSPGDVVKPSSTQLTSVFSEADHTIDLDEFITFPTMQEVIKELVPATYTRSRKNQEFIRINVNSPLPPSQHDPVYIIDGNVTLNTAYVLELDPAEIKTIKVYKSATKLLQMGLFGANGLLVIESRNNNLKPPDSNHISTFQGIHEPFKFTRTEFNSEIPQFRSILFWSPELRPDGNAEHLKVQALDDQSGYYIIVRGFLINGTPFSTYKKFTVNFDQ